MPLPTPSTPGYTSFRGRTCCTCLAAWLPAFEAELIARGVIKESIDIAQLTGDADKSAGVHSQGGAFDIRQCDPATIRVARKMGADATWARTGAAWAGNEHAHGVLTGCPHNGPARYQIEAVLDGFNGLGSGGRGGKDDGPRPLFMRSWQEGISWHKAQNRRRKIRSLIQSLKSRIRLLEAERDRLPKP